MGEQVEKPPEEKKPEEEKKEEPVKTEEKKEAAPAADDKKEEVPPLPPPPQEIVLRVFMHCEGCARKVRRCLRGFDGVEDIQTDCKTHKVVVKGEKADPLKILERVQKKSHRKVELLSPIPKPPAEEPKAEEKQPPKPEEKKEEPPQVITLVLQINMHCEACAQEIRKRIFRMKGVESVEPDLKNSQVSVKGTFTAPQLVQHIYKKTKKKAVVVKQDPEPKKEEAGGDKGKEEKKDDGAAEKKEESKDGGAASEKKEESKDKDEKKDGGGEEAKAEGDPAAAAGGDEMKGMELRKNEINYNLAQNVCQTYPPRYTAESSYWYPPAPQMFSDENPNACSVM